MPSVLWIPTVPSFGSVSMQRYFGSLWAEREEGLADGLSDFGIEALVPYTGLMTKADSRLFRALDRWGIYRWRVATAGRFDLVHALSHGLGFLLPHLRGSPRTLATVHDLIPMRFRGELTDAQLGRFRRHMERLKNFDLLTSVSHFTADEMVELAGIDRGRIRVVENGIDQEAFRTPASFPPELSHLKEQPYILSVSSSIARKNLSILPEVFAEVFAREPELKLVRAGSYFSPGLREEFCRRCGEERLIELGRVPDEVLVPAYQHAAVFFFPSLYEGFGLPVIEAMASGTPVVCSNTSSLPEVGKDAALYFDPADPAAGAAGILEALSKADELVPRGLEHSKTYSWQRTLEGHLTCYRELLS
ncbi:MAG: hypothetical protein CMP28_11390 [Roseibacillus sp.]|nr:hypothetical protein [Roseibacillus sp.]